MWSDRKSERCGNEKVGEREGMREVEGKVVKEREGVREVGGKVERERKGE